MYKILLDGLRSSNTKTVSEVLLCMKLVSEQYPDAHSPKDFKLVSALVDSNDKDVRNNALMYLAYLYKE